jgi:hypothetical protein
VKEEVALGRALENLEANIVDVNGIIKELRIYYYKMRMKWSQGERMN